MKNYGNQKPVWKDSEPARYDKKTRIVCFGFEPATKEENGKEIKGFLGFEIQIDGLIDYGHIKSQLVEAAYAQKDEFGTLMNATGELISLAKADKKIADCDFSEFEEVQEWRTMCANAAKYVMSYYNGEN